MLSQRVRPCRWRHRLAPNEDNLKGSHAEPDDEARLLRDRDLGRRSSGFYSRSDIRGLYIEAETLDEFESLVVDLAPDLIVENHLS